MKSWSPYRVSSGTLCGRDALFCCSFLNVRTIKAEPAGPIEQMRVFRRDGEADIVAKLPIPRVFHGHVTDQAAIGRVEMDQTAGAQLLDQNNASGDMGAR